MKFYYPYPTIFESDPVELQGNSQSMGILALNQNHHFVLVGECLHPKVWQSFWGQVGSTPLSHITITSDTSEDENNISNISTILEKSLEYIIANQYLFIGVLYWDKNVQDKQIIDGWGVFSSKKAKRFLNMLETYHNYEQFPYLIDEKYVETKIIGTGEKFLDFETLSLEKIAKMTHMYKGSLSGIFGIPSSSNLLELVILSQNITKENLQPLVLDKVGRQTLSNWVKLDQFIPAGGFKLDYGLWGLSNLPNWSSMSLIPRIQQIMNKYNKYLSAKIDKRDDKLPHKKIAKPFLSDTFSILHALFHKDNNKVDAIPIKLNPIQKINPQVKLQSIKSQPLSKISLQKPSLQPLQSLKVPPQSNKGNELQTTAKESAEVVPLEKPDISKYLSPSQDEEDLDGYDDIFNQSKEESALIQEGKMVLDANDLDDFLDDGTSLIESDLGQMIDPRFMDEESIFKDLESSLAALSKLDELAEKDAAQMRLYYPPPTLVSYANEDGMEIGGSTCVMSIGVGRSIWTIPELRRMQMWGEFWRQEDVQGNPQIKDFIAFNSNKDINSPEQLEDILQKAFIRIRRNSQLFLGIAEFEGNGFESVVFQECDMEQDHLDKLADIHAHKRSEMQFPEISQESWIELRYYGKPHIIKFLANPHAQGTLEIAKDINENKIYQKGILTGIICLEEEAANFFILTDNLEDLDNEDPDYEIDQVTMTKMFETIEKLKLTPVSWCKIRFGFAGFEDLFLWEDIKDGIIMQIVKESYQKYYSKLLTVQKSEDVVRIKYDSELDAITTNVMQCAHCGTENPYNASTCIACGKILKS